MPRGSDGAIIIDSRIDTSGFNEGIANLAKLIKRIASISGAIYISGKAWDFVKKSISRVIRAVKDFARAFRMFIRGLEYISRIGRRIEEVRGEFENLRVQLYAALLPAILALLPVIYKIINALQVVARFIGFIIGALTGNKTVLEANVKGANDLADATGRAKKEAQGALAAFDEIDVLQQPDEDTGGGAGGIGNLGLDEIPIPDKLLAFIERLKVLLTPLWQALVRLWEEFKRVVSIWWGIVSPMFASFFEEGGLFEGIVALMVKAIDWLSKKLNELGTWMLENEDKVRKFTLIVLYVAVILGGMLLMALLAVIVVIAAVVAIVVAVILAFTWLGKKAIEIWPTIQGVFQKMADIVKWYLEKFMEAFRLMVDFAAYILNKIGEFFKRVWNNVTNWSAQALLDIRDFFRGLLDDAGRILANIGQFFSNLWNSVTNWSANAINSIIKFLGLLLGNAAIVLNSMGKFFQDLWKKVTDWAANAINSIGGSFTILWGNVTRGASTAFNSLANFFKTAANAVIGVMNSLIGGIVGGLNAVIKALNGISVTIPNWVPVFGGNTFGISLPTISAPQIPRLAAGAVLQPNAPFLAIMGDQRSGRNIEAPESLIRQIVSEAISDQKVSISFEGTLGALVRELKPHIDKENTRVGHSMVRGMS